MVALYGTDTSVLATDEQVRDFEKYGREEMMLQKFDAQNKIVWKAAKHNIIEVVDQSFQNEIRISPNSRSQLNKINFF